MSNPSTSWQGDPLSTLVLQVSAAMENAARGLSFMLGRTITTGTAQAKILHFDDRSAEPGRSTAEMVGIYLLMEGEMGGRAVLVLTKDSALNLADLLLDDQPGTSTSLDELGRSALQELGNVTVAYFLNAMSSLTGKDLRPSPPTVIIDMMDAILKMLAASMGTADDDQLIIETAIHDIEGLVQAHFWVLPDLASQIQ